MTERSAHTGKIAIVARRTSIQEKGKYAMTQALNRIRIALNLSAMTDEELLQLIVAITALAPQSSLISIASIASCVARSRRRVRRSRATATR